MSYQNRHPIEPLLEKIFNLIKIIAENAAKVVEILKGIHDQIIRGIQEIVRNLGFINQSIYEVQIISFLANLRASEARLGQEEDIIEEIEKDFNNELKLYDEKFYKEKSKALEQRNKNVYRVCQYIFEILEDEARFVDDKLVNDLMFDINFEETVSKYISESETEALKMLKNSVKKKLRAPKESFMNIRTYFEKLGLQGLRQSITEPALIFLPIIEGKVGVGNIFPLSVEIDEDGSKVLKQTNITEEVAYEGKPYREAEVLKFSVIREYIKKNYPDISDRQMLQLEEIYNITKKCRLSFKYTE